MKNIYSDGYGYRVQIERNGIRFDSFIGFGTDRAAALQKAVAVRDDFLAKAEVLRSRSNTGVAGITELSHWTSGSARQCFQVTCGSPGPGWMRRFFYRTFAERQRALRAACHHRARRAGEPVQQLMEAAGV